MPKPSFSPKDNRRRFKELMSRPAGSSLTADDVAIFDQEIQRRRDQAAAREKFQQYWNEMASKVHSGTATEPEKNSYYSAFDVNAGQQALTNAKQALVAYRQGAAKGPEKKKVIKDAKATIAQLQDDLSGAYKAQGMVTPQKEQSFWETLLGVATNTTGRPQSALPGMQEVDRDLIGGVVGGGAYATGASLTNVGGVLTEGAAVVNEKLFDQQHRQQYTAAQNTLDYGTRLLEAAVTDEDRAKAEQMIAYGQRKLDALERERALQTKDVRAGAESVYSAADNLQVRSSDLIQKAKMTDFGMTDAGNLLVDAGVSGVQMAGDALANAIVPGSGLAALGVRAFGSGAQEARQNGATYGQQVGFGLGTAATEIATEKMFGVFENIYGAGWLDNTGMAKSLTKAIQKMNLTPIGRTALELIGKSGEEAIEELTSGVVSPVLDSIYNGKSVGQNYAEMDPSDLLHDALVGGILGLAGANGQIAQNAAQTQYVGEKYRGKDDGVATLIQDTFALDPENKTAQAAQKKLDSGGKVSDSMIRRMVEENEQRTIGADMASVQDSVAARLVELGETEENAKSLASVVAKQWANGQVADSSVSKPDVKPSHTERKALENSAAAQQVVKELNAEEDAPEWVQGIETKRVKTGTQYTREYSQLRERLVREFIDTQTDRKALAVDDTAELEKEFGKAGAELFQKAAPRGVDGRVYYHAFNTAFLYGSTGGTLEAAQKAVAGRISDTIVQAAYDAGKGRADFLAQQNAQRMAGKMTGAKVRGAGKVDMSTIDTVGLSDVQWASINALRKIAEATGINVRLFESGTRADGTFVGKNGEYNASTNEVAIDINAGRRAIGDGLAPVMLKTMGHELTHFIQENNREGYRQLKEFITRRLAEKGHNLEDLAWEKVRRSEGSEDTDTLTYDEAMDEVIADACENMLKDTTAIETLAKENWSLFKQIRNWIRKFCNAIRRAFAAEGHISPEAEMLVDDMAEIQKLWDGAFVTAVHNYQQTGEVQDLVTENGKTAGVQGEDGSTVLSLRTYDEGGREIYKNFLDKEVKAKRLTRADADDMMQQLEQVYQICQEFAGNEKYGTFGAWSHAEVRTDPETGKPVFSVVKANGEYALNLDFSLVCKKRRTLDAVFQTMIADGIMEDFGMVESSIAYINDIIRQHGFETACSLCFVDSKRYRQAMVADAFVGMYNELVRSMIKDGQHADAFNYGGNTLVQNDGAGIDTLSDDQLDFTRIDEVLASEDSGTVLYKIAKNLKEHPQDRKVLLRGDFMSAAAFDNVKQNNPRVMSLYNAKKGAGGPKASSLDVQYLNEIIQPRKFNVKKAYSVGGVRIQSFSDYVPRLVFDYVQMIADLSGKKLPAHAYTKEAMFALQFGMTGIKTNMSLVPEVVEGGIAPGLDKDGNYAWRDGQSFGSTVYGSGEAFIRKCCEIIGIEYTGQERLTAAQGFELAKAIQSAAGYSGNCGTIAVGVSDAHIFKLLRDNDVRMVIPYHKSSLNHIVAVMENIDKFHDYTGVQNTRKWNGTDWVRLDKGEKDFNFNDALRRTGDAKAAADEYLAWCAKKGYMPKFDTFMGEENYYKLLEDFTCYDMDGNAAPQSGVTMTLPTADSAFGSLQDMIQMGLEEDALLQGKQDAAVKDIVDEIKKTLPAFEAQQRVQKSERDVRTAFVDGRITVSSTEEERYAVLKDATITPATVDMDKLDGVSLDVFNTRSKSSVEKGMRSLAAKLGVTGVDISASQLDFPFRFSNTNLFKSLHHQLEYGGTYQDYAKALTCFADIVEGAVPIETHAEKKTGTSKANPDLEQVYVLVGAFLDGDDVVPVQLEVKKYKRAVAGLYLNVMLTKIDSGVLERPSPTEIGTRISPLFPKPNYTLRSLLANVNTQDGRFLKYAPDGFLDEERLDAKEKALQRQKDEYAHYDAQYSLRDVDPVQPNNGGWQRTIDTQEALRRFPGLWNVTAEESEVRNPTQIKSTVSTYRKIYDLLKADGFDGTILDASSGLGYGTRAGREEYGLDVDDIEPYPDASYKPRYTDYSRLNKTYDAIISNAVLNVLPQDQRDALVVKMGEMLNPGGKMYINVRGKDVDTLASGKDNVRISPMEWYVASTGSYQKGFTKAELKAYLEDALGPGYTVETTSKFGGVAVIVTKDTERVQHSDRDVESFTTKESIDAEIDRVMDQIRDIQNAQWQANDAAKRDPRVQEAQQKMWAAEDANGYSGAVRERVEYRRILKQVKEELAAQIPEGDLNELAQRVQELKELREQYLKVTPITAAQYDKLAKHFGTTEDYGVAGFILKDGRMLDFSGKKQYGRAYSGGREVYHNEVGDVLGLPTDTSPRIDMVSNGNIRLVPEINGINLAQMPTEEQRDALRGFIEFHNGSVHVDIDNAAGRTVETFGYGNGTSASRILADIDNYFRTGAAPAAQSGLREFYSERDVEAISDRELLANALATVAQNPAERDILQRYQAKTAELGEIQTKLAEQRALMRDHISGAKKLSTEDLLKARNRAQLYAKQLDRADRELLKLESMGPVKAMLDREHKAYRKALKAEKRAEALRQRYNEKLTQQIEDSRQRMANYRQKRKDTETRRRLRDRISTSVKQLDTMLRRPTDQRHIPDGLQSAVLDMLEEFTNDTSVFSRAKLARVTAEYQKLQTADTNLAGQYDEDIPEMLNDLAETIDGRRLSQLSATELQTVRNIVDHFAFMVKNENAIFVNGRRQSLTDMAESVITQSEEKGYKVTADFGKADGLVRLLTTGNIKPEYFFRDIGGEMQTLWNALKTGQNRYAFHLQDAKAAKEAIQRATGYREWWNDKTTYTATTEAGQSITLNLGQALSLLATYQRELATGNTNHVTMGGFLYAEDVKKRAGLKDVKRGQIPGVNYRTENRDAHPMSAKDMEALTEWLRGVDARTLDYVERMVRYISEDMAALGNETSLELYGYRKFGEEYYFPIKSAEEFLKTEPGRSGYDNSRIKNMGFSKATIRGANNPFVLMDFDEVWGQHVSQMCLYNGMAGAQDNIVRLLNYKHRVSEDGPSTSVKAAFKSGYGDKALQYIDTLLADLNGGVMIDPREGALNSMISLFKKNAVFASMSVAIQQPSSIARAMAVMDPKYLVQTAAQKRDYEELKRHSGVAIIKEIGGFDTNTGRSGAEWLMSGRKSNLVEKYETAATWLPQKMDEITWGHIWNAVKAEIADTTDLAPGSEEFFRRCGERFDEVIELTQVYDSVLTRSENMRSKSGLVKAATAFMAEPTTALNMMMDAIQNGKKNPKQLARTMGAIAVSIVLNNLLKAIVTAPRDKDDDRTWLEKYVRKLVGGIADDVKPWGYVPLVKDVQDIIDGYTVEASYASVVSDLVKAVKAAFKEPTVDSGIDALAAISGLFGVPLKNLVRDARGVINTFVNTRPLDETTTRGLQKAAEEALGLKTKLSDDIENLYKADTKGNAARRQKYLDEIAREYEDKMKAFVNDGYSKDEAAKKARSSIMRAVTEVLKPLYQAAQTTAEKNRIRSLALRIYFGGRQLYAGYDFDRYWAE